MQLSQYIALQRSQRLSEGNHEAHQSANEFRNSQVSEKRKIRDGGSLLCVNDLAVSSDS